MLENAPIYAKYGQSQGHLQRQNSFGSQTHYHRFERILAASVLEHLSCSSLLGQYVYDIPIRESEIDKREDKAH